MGRVVGTESRVVVARVWDEGGMGRCRFNWHRVSVWETKKVLEMDGGDGYTMWCVLKSTELYI